MYCDLFLGSGTLMLMTAITVYVEILFSQGQILSKCNIPFWRNYQSHISIFMQYSLKQTLMDIQYHETTDSHAIKKNKKTFSFFYLFFFTKLYLIP